MATNMTNTYISDIDPLIIMKKRKITFELYHVVTKRIYDCITCLRYTKSIENINKPIYRCSACKVDIPKRDLSSKDITHVNDIDPIIITNKRILLEELLRVIKPVRNCANPMCGPIYLTSSSATLSPSCESYPYCCYECRDEQSYAEFKYSMRRGTGRRSRY
jgi:hypothetical protein